MFASANCIYLVCKECVSKEFSNLNNMKKYYKNVYYKMNTINQKIRTYLIKKSLSWGRSTCFEINNNKKSLSKKISNHIQHLS